MRYLGGHLGTAVSALLDGQLDPASTERAWAHVRACALCDQQVTREGWVKTRLSAMAGEEPPPPQLLGSLYGMGSGAAPATDRLREAHAWATVHEMEERSRHRRRAGLVVAGAGSVSAAVFGIASLTGSTLGIVGAPSGTPTTAVTDRPGPSADATTVIAPLARVHGRVELGGPTAEQPRPPRRDGFRGEGSGRLSH